MARKRQRSSTGRAGDTPLIRRARGALAAGRLADAASLARQALAAAPADAGALHVLGAAALREGATGQALQLLSEAVSRRPDDADLLIDHAEALRANGDFEQAAARCRRAAELAPGNARAAAGLGLASMAAGHREQGVTALRRALELAPRAGDIAMHLAGAAHESGDLELAAQALARATRCRETALAAQLGLGGVGLALGDTGRARAAFEAALRLQPGHPRARLGVAMSAEQAGDLDEALRRYRAVLERDPDDSAAWDGVARVASALRQHELAVEATRRLLDASPSSAERRVAAVRALLANDRLDDARRLCEEGLVSGEDADLAVLRADLHLLAGEHDPAAALLRRVLARTPEHADATNRLGEVLLQQGDLEQAGECFRRALAAVPGHELAWENLSLLPRRLHQDSDVAALRKVLKSPPPRPLAHATLLFALAGLLDAAGEHDAAGEVLEPANRLVHERVPWDADGYRRLVAELLAIDAGVIDRLAAHGHHSPLPLFIVGMPRSGTTLLEQMLGGHPRVHAAGEVMFFNHVRVQHDSLSYPASLRGLDPSLLAGLGEQYLQKVVPVNTAPERVTDKLPANFLRLPLIAAVFPNARFIHLRRSVEDIGLSVYRQNFAVPEGNAWAYSMADIATYHAGYERVMQHWHAVLGERLLALDYENLVAEPERELRRVLAHAGLPWDPACLAFAGRKRAVATASVAQVREPLHARNIGRAARQPRLLAMLRSALAVERATTANEAGA